MVWAAVRLNSTSGVSSMRFGRTEMSDGRLNLGWRAREEEESAASLRKSRRV